MECLNPLISLVMSIHRLHTHVTYCKPTYKDYADTLPVFEVLEYILCSYLYGVIDEL